MDTDEDLPLDWSEFPPKKSVQCGTPDRLRELYKLQRSVPGYRSLIQSNITIFGTIDGEFEYTNIFFLSLNNHALIFVVYDNVPGSLFHQTMTTDATMPIELFLTSLKVPRHSLTSLMNPENRP